MSMTLEKIRCTAQNEREDNPCHRPQFEKGSPTSGLRIYPPDFVEKYCPQIGLHNWVGRSDELGRVLNMHATGKSLILHMRKSIFKRY
jgi:hypothetical protein